MSHLSEQLNASGLKVTMQRLGILEATQKAGHSSVDDIYTAVREKHPLISLATVYKNIQILVEKGMMIEVPIAGFKSKYEIKKHDHVHLICQKCGSIRDRMMEDVAQEHLTLSAQKESFSLTRSQINLYGICQKCQK